MLYLLIGLSALFASLGFLVTTKNARYILAGYNTMSETEREKVNIEGYIAFFKKFHFLLGISLLIVGLALHLLKQELAGIFLTLYPLFAYSYFIVRSNRFMKGSGKTQQYLGLVVIAFSILFVGFILLSNMKENVLQFEGSTLNISGKYGVNLSLNEMESITMVDELPQISYRSNGFGLGSVRKGYFKTKNGETVKLILNSGQKPLIFFKTREGKKIYFSARSASNQEIYRNIKSQWP